MTENKRFKLKIIGDINDVDSEIILKDRGQPLCEFINIEDARLVRDLLNELHEENQRLTNKLNNTALELVGEVISQGKATEISEMSYDEFLEYRAKNGKPMELQL